VTDVTCIAEPEVLDLLTRLVEKSLVSYEEDEEGNGRYRLLETVHQYALGKLGEEHEGDVSRCQHRDYFLSLAEKAKQALAGPQQGEWLDRLEAEHDNLRTALSWCGADPEGAEAGLRLAAALWRFWNHRGYLREGRTRLQAALTRPEAQEMNQARGDALNGAGSMAYRLGEFREARALFQQALTIRRALGDRWGAAMSLNNLGKVATEYERDPAAGREYLEESLAILRELGDRQGFALALSNLGETLHEQREYGAARAVMEESLVIQREIGDAYETAQNLYSLGLTATALADYEAAGVFLREGLAIRREIGNRQGFAESLEALAGLSVTAGRASGDPGTLSSQRAARIWGAAERLREELGSPIVPSDLPQHERDVAAAREALGEEVLHAAWAEGRALPLAEAIALALGEGAVA
jgi:non-specific serine/threonine protein kinase